MHESHRKVESKTTYLSETTTLILLFWHTHINKTSHETHDMDIRLYRWVNSLINALEGEWTTFVKSL